MYQKLSTQKSSPSPRSKSGSKEPKPSGGYGSLSGVVQKAQREPSQVGEEELQQLDSAVGTRATGEILARKKNPMMEFKGLSTQLWGDSGDVGVPIQAKGKDDVSVSEMQPENKTGLPDKLKAGIENLSGMAIDDVRVHYNSHKPAQLHALAYTQGTNIHVAPGQERYLPHEAWHVVQQKQGRVKPTIESQGMAINDERQLETEADVKGAQALRMGRDTVATKSRRGEASQSKIVQGQREVMQMVYPNVTRM